MANRSVSFVLAVLISLGLIASASAQDGQSLRRTINKGTVGLIAGAIDETDMMIATDMSSVLDSDDIRILAMAGKSSLQNIEDLLYLRGVDIALVQADALSYAQRDGSYANIENRVHYISHIYDETLHLVARQGIGSVTDLEGQQVAVGPPGSKSAITARIVFEDLGVDVIPSPLEGGNALDMVKNGQLSAMLAVADTNSPPLQSLSQEDGVKFLPLFPSEELRRIYQPAVLTSEEYPQLIPQDSVIETLAVGTVLAVYNWEPNTLRYNKVARFVEAFLSLWQEEHKVKFEYNKDKQNK